jgi:hypothetical protein
MAVVWDAWMTTSSWSEQVFAVTAPGVMLSLGFVADLEVDGIHRSGIAG